MAVSRLQDDLLHEFREEKQMIQSQIELLEPLAASLRKPVALRLAGKGLILFTELLCWTLVLAAVAMAIFLNKLYPYYLLYELKGPSAQDMQMLKWSVYALILAIGLLFVFLARGLARIRQGDSLRQSAGSRIKTLLEQMRKRRASLEALEQKYFNELPAEIIVSKDVNKISNPGYDADEGL